VGEAVSVGKVMTVGVTPGGKVDIRVAVGDGKIGLDGRLQAVRSNTSSPAKSRLGGITIFIMEKSKRVKLANLGKAC